VAARGLQSGLHLRHGRACASADLRRQPAGVGRRAHLDQEGGLEARVRQLTQRVRQDPIGLARQLLQLSFVGMRRRLAPRGLLCHADLLQHRDAPAELAVRSD
jgi:hypothetical protein